MLNIENVKKTYSDFTLDISMKVNKGCVTGLVGTNGSGKTTTFKAILDLIKIEEGKIEVFGVDSKNLSKTEKEKIGVVFYNSTFNLQFTIKDVIPILKSFYPTFDENYYMNLVRKNKLPLDKEIRNFSTGMLARFKLINAIGHKPKLLILDEPTAGLDVIARDLLIEIIRDYLEEDEENSVLISSHISKDLEKLCDDFYLIKEGKIVLHEETDVLMSNYGVIKTNLDDKDIDLEYILASKEDKYCKYLLTDQVQYYIDNYKNVTIERAGIDEIVTYLGGY